LAHKRRSTLKDVARHAGVSITTVSQVVNNSTGGNIRISQETRDRVWQAVQALGYTPNASARSLRTRKTNLLAVLVPDIANPFYPQLIRGIQDVAPSTAMTCWSTTPTTARSAKKPLWRRSCAARSKAWRWCRSTWGARISSASPRRTSRWRS
jgi:transcriptional regulator with XRE-family HTH domain